MKIKLNINKHNWWTEIDNTDFSSVDSIQPYKIRDILLGVANAFFNTVIPPTITTDEALFINKSIDICINGCYTAIVTVQLGDFNRARLTLIGKEIVKLINIEIDSYQELKDKCEPIYEMIKDSLNKI